MWSCVFGSVGGSDRLAFVRIGEGRNVGVGKVGDVIEAKLFSGLMKMHKY